MHERIQLASDSGLIVFHDESTILPDVEGEDRLREVLREGAGAGGWFMLDEHDTVNLRVDLFVGEDPSGLPDGWFAPMGEPRRVELPQGRMMVAGEGPFVLEPGTYSLSVLGPRPFDAATYDRLMVEQFGERAWRYHRLVDRLGMIGCTVTTFAPVPLLSSRVREYWYVPVGLMLLAWLPHLVLRRLEPYRSIEARREAHELSLPHYAVHLERVTGESELTGGWLQISANSD